MVRQLWVLLVKVWAVPDLVGREYSTVWGGAVPGLLPGRIPPEEKDERGVRRSGCHSSGACSLEFMAMGGKRKEVCVFGWSWFCVSLTTRQIKANKGNFTTIAGRTSENLEI